MSTSRAAQPTFPQAQYDETRDDDTAVAEVEPGVAGQRLKGMHKALIWASPLHGGGLTC